MAVLNRQRVSTKNCYPPFSTKNCSSTKDRAAAPSEQAHVHESNKRSGGSSSRASKRKRHDEQQREEERERRIEKQQQQQLELEQYLKSRPPKKRILKPSDKMRFAFNTDDTKHQSPLAAVAIDLNKAPPDWCGDIKEDHGIYSKGMRSWGARPRSVPGRPISGPCRSQRSSMNSSTDLELGTCTHRSQTVSEQESGLPASKSKSGTELSAHISNV